MLNFSNKRHPSNPTGPPPMIATLEVSIYFNFGLYSDLNYSQIESKFDPSWLLINDHNQIN